MPYKEKEARLAAQRRSYQRHKEKVKATVRAHKISKKAEWLEYKKTLSCTQCGQNHPATLDFHHVIRSPENRKLHVLLRSGAYKQAFEEIKKCLVLCANCHRILHYNEHHDKKKARKKKDKSP